MLYYTFFSCDIWKSTSVFGILFNYFDDFLKFIMDTTDRKHSIPVLYVRGSHYECGYEMVDLILVQFIQFNLIFPKNFRVERLNL